MDHFKLPICSFSFERWKVWWGNEGIDDIGGWLDGGEGFCEGRPHAPSASGADGDVGVGVLYGEDEEWVDRNAINVENVMCTGEARKL